MDTKKIVELAKKDMNIVIAIVIAVVIGGWHFLSSPKVEDVCEHSVSLMIDEMKKQGEEDGTLEFINQFINEDEMVKECVSSIEEEDDISKKQMKCILKADSLDEMEDCEE